MTRPIPILLLILLLGGSLALILRPGGSPEPNPIPDSGELEKPSSGEPAVRTEPIAPRQEVFLSLPGYVFGSDGKPLAGVTVSLDRITGPGSQREFTAIGSEVSGEDGLFTFDRVPPDLYRVTAAHVGYATQRVNQTIVAGQTVDPITLQLVPGLTIRGIVRDSLGAPLPDALVSAFPEGGSSNELLEERLLRLQNLESIESPASSARTDASGVFLVERLADEPYRLRVRGPGHGVAEQRFVAAGSDDLEFNLTTGGALEVTVLNTDGDRVPEARVHVRQLVKNPDIVERVSGHAFPPIATGESDASGQVRIDSLGGDFEFHLTVEAAGHQARDGGVVQLSAGETSTLEIVLVPGETIEGIVRDPSGAPLEGARVRISAPVADGNPLAAFPRPPIVTDADGRFLRDDLPALPHLVSVFHEEYASTLVRNLLPSDEVHDLTLSIGAVLGGTVTDAETSEPLEGVTLQVIDAAGEPRTSVSTTEGAFELRGLTPNKQSKVYVSAHRAGYETISGRPFVVVEGSATTGQDLSLRPNGSVRGFALDIDGNPIPGVLIIAKRPIPGGLATVATVARSSASGEFYFPDVSPGMRTFLIGTHGDFVESESEGFEVESGIETTDVILTMNMGGDVRGRVVDSSGSPIANAVIGVRGEQMNITDPSRLPIHTRTDELGNFLLRRLPAGDLTLLASAEGFLAVEITGHEVIDARLLDDIEVKLATGARLSGFVQDRSGAGIEDATVIVLDTSVGLKKFTTTTADDGSFSFSQLGPYPVEVEARAQGHGKVRLSEQEVNRDDVVLVLESFGGVRGRVISSSGDSLPAYNVSPRLLDEQGRPVPRVPSRSFTTDNFDFGGLVPGTYEVLIGATDHAPILLENIVVRPRRFTELQNVSLTAGGEISCVVFEEKTGFAVEDARIKVLGGEENFHLDGTTGPTVRRGGRSELRSDENGKFKLKGLYVDVVTLEIQKSGLVTLTIDVPVGSRDLPIGLVPGGSIEGAVTGPVSTILADQQVLLTPISEGAGHRRTARTDRRGRYLFSGLPPGEYKLEVTEHSRSDLEKGPGGKIHTYTATVVAGETVQLDLYYD